MLKFKLSVLTLALASAGMGLCAQSAWAAAAQEQAAPAATAATNTTDSKKTKKEEEIEVIEVRSFAGSLIQSLNVKRFNDTVSETISADDLGALPDVSMADALTRLPGVSAVRTGGQASEINIRGMEGGFVFSTLNGREQVSTNGKRNIEFDQYPSELINSAAVYKSPKASLIEGGVAGTVELQTASPLKATKEHNFVMNARGSFNDRANEVSDATETGNRLSFSYQGKFLDETLGVSLGYARLFQPSVATQFVGFNYNQERDLDGAAGDTAQELVSEGFEMQHRGGEETRNGYVAALEWQPNDKLRVKADAFISKFDTEAFARGFRAKFESGTAIIDNPVIVDNIMVGGTVKRRSDGMTRVEMVNDDNTDYDEVRSYGFNTQYDVTDNWTVAVDVAHSSSSSNFRNGLLWSLASTDATAARPVVDPNVSITYQLNGLNLPGIGISNAASFTDINKMMVSKYGIYPTLNTDEVDAYRFDSTYKLENDYISSVEAGMRYSERDYTNDRQVFEYGSDALFLSSEPPLRLTQDMVKRVDFKGEFAAFPSYLAVDLDKALNAWFPNGIPQPKQTWGNGYSGLANPVAGGKSTPWSVTESGDVAEKVVSAYVMANLDMQVFNLPLTGNFGVRMVETTQKASNMTYVDGDPAKGAQYITDEAGLVTDDYAPSVVGLTYTDYLPSLNLNLAMTDNDQLRFAYAKVMSRPPINQLSSVTTFNIASNGDVSGSSTRSPFLKPFYADQFDLSYERYFEDSNGAFVAALFYKDIKSFIQQDTITDFDFAEAGFPLPDYVPGTEPGNPDGLPPKAVNPIGDYSTAVNNDQGGYIRGVELAYTQVFKDLPSFWSGLGISASYSYTESEIETEVVNGRQSFKAELKGLSPNVYTVTAFWEYEGFETRLSTRFRDDFVSDQSALADQEIRYDAETVMDYQASYQVNDNLGLLFQVNNLLDEPTKSYWGDTAYTGTIQFFGRQYYLGANYTF
ncbi:MAG: TonB-dependent receptor [Gammaproteobacteria bacterium]|nr:TonB-dependent receptor [Gammaproteobacteria bacterium]